MPSGSTSGSDGAVVGLRALSDYDDIFALTPVPAPAPAAAGLQAAR